jgi:uncharacterized membrane protein YbaN (DUF454 family)
MSDQRLYRSSLLRVLLWLCGTLFLIVGIIGIALPGLPTTPFVLLSAACFVRASPRAHRWLLQHPSFGPTLRAWEEHRTISHRIRNVALLSMLLTGSFSVWFLAGRPWLQTLVAITIAIGLLVVLRLKIRD